MLTGEKKAGLVAAIQDAHVQADKPADAPTPEVKAAPDKPAKTETATAKSDASAGQPAQGAAPPRPDDKAEPAKSAATPAPEPAQGSQHVPFDRFKQVYDKGKQYRAEAEQAKAELDRLRQELSRAPQPQRQAEADPLDEVYGKQPDFRQALSPYEKRIEQLERAHAVQTLKAEIDSVRAQHPEVPFEVLRQAVVVDADADLDMVARQYLHDQGTARTTWEKELRAKWDSEQASKAPAPVAATPAAAPPRPATTTSQTPPNVQKGVNLKDPQTRRRALAESIAHATGWSR